MQGAGLQFVRFKKDIPSQNIQAGRVSRAHIQKMRLQNKIQVFPYYGELDYFFNVPDEEALLEILEPLTDLQALSATPNPSVKASTGGVLPN